MVNTGSSVSIVAGLGILGTLLAPAIQGWLALRQRKLNIFLSSRVHVYRELFKAVIDYSRDPHDAEKQFSYLAAIDVAKSFASKEVCRILEDGEHSLAGIMTQMRRKEKTDHESIRDNELREVMRRLTDECRRDMTKLQ